MAQDNWRKIKNARQRLVLCRLMIDIMRALHGIDGVKSPDPAFTDNRSFFLRLAFMPCILSWTPLLRRTMTQNLIAPSLMQHGLIQQFRFYVRPARLSLARELATDSPVCPVPSPVRPCQV
jgi:hypothetical protein